MKATNGRDLGILVVGVGNFGAQRAAAATLARGIQLVAVTDLNRNTAAQVADHHGVAVAPNLRAGLRFCGVDALVIATPHADHAGQVRLALEAGKHVFCEKPLTVDPIEARELAALAQASQLRLATGFNHRHYRPVRDAVALATSGALGRIEEVRARIGHWASHEFLSGWHADVARSGGGTLLDNGPHACDLIRRLLGEVSGAEGTITDRIGLPRGCESEAHVRFRGRDGGFAELSSSWTLEQGYLTIEVTGSLGSLRVETAPWRLEGTLADGTRIKRTYLACRIRERLRRHWLRCDSTLVRELEAFATPRNDRQHPDASANGWDGCRATEMVQAAYESARTGQEVHLEPLPVRLPGDARRDREASTA